MANTQIEIKTNGTTTLETAGKYCDRNIDINVAVPPSGITPTGTKTITENGTHDVTNFASAVVNVQTAQPTRFTNYYDPANVTIGQYISASSSSGVTYTESVDANWVKIQYHHTAGADVVLRLRGIGTVRSRTTLVTFLADGTTRQNHFTMTNTSFFEVTYDEYGDLTITFKSTSKSAEWYYFAFCVQYPFVDKATTALTGPIITINEPIGNGGYVG